MTSLRKKHELIRANARDGKFNFQQRLVLSELHILQFLLSWHSFILRSSFLLNIPRFIWVLSKLEYISMLTRNGGSKMADIYGINDVDIMA